MLDLVTRSYILPGFRILNCSVTGYGVYHSHSGCCAVFSLICISVLCFSGLRQHHPGILFIYKKHVVFKDSFLDITDMLSGTFSSCIYRVLCALHQTVTI